MSWLCVISMLLKFIATCVYSHAHLPFISCLSLLLFLPPSLSPPSLSHLNTWYCVFTQTIVAQWYIWRRCLYSHWTNLKVSIHCVCIKTFQCTIHTDSLLCRNHWSWHWELHHLEFWVWQRLLWSRVYLNTFITSWSPLSGNAMLGSPPHPTRNYGNHL